MQREVLLYFSCVNKISIAAKSYQARAKAVVALMEYSYSSNMIRFSSCDSNNTSGKKETLKCFVKFKLFIKRKY